MKTETKSALERIFNNLSKHPFLTVAVMCAMLFFFGFCERSSFSSGSYVYAGAVLIVAIALLLMLGRIGKDLKEKIVILLSMSVFVVGSLLLIRNYNNSPVLIFWISLIMIAMLAALLWVTGALTTRNFIILMMAAGVMLRFAYVLYTSSSDRQHDVGIFNGTAGHANYIEYWYKNGLKLPDFDVRKIWQYYQPPLHHWLMALLLKVLSLFGMRYDQACQALQILPMLYSSLTMVVCYRIFRFAKLKEAGLAIAMAILCFHPTFVLMGGYFNNDMLSTLLLLTSIMFTLKWYRKPTFRNIIPIALAIGLGMMAKLSAWMAAPAVALIFLYVLIKNIRKPWGLIGQYAAFGVICAPLALWWQIRNYFAFGVPLTYVPFLGEGSSQYLGKMTATQRLFDFGNDQLSFVYTAFTDPSFGAPYNDYNPTISVFKTSLFGEGKNAISDIHYPQISTAGPLLFWVGVILGLLCFAAFIFMMVSKKSGLDGLHRAFFGLLAGTMLVAYYLYGFSYPFTCSMNIRFCAAVIPIIAMGAGLLLQTFKNRVLRCTVCTLTGLFALLSTNLFCMIGT